MKNIPIVLILVLALAGCKDLTGPEGASGRTVEPDSFTFTVAGTASAPLADLAAFSAALQTALEAQPAGDSVTNPIAVTAGGLYLARRDDLTALYRALVRHVALDLGGCGGTLYVMADNPNREKIVSLTLPPSVVLLEPGTQGTFRNYTGLASVDIPGLEHAGDNAFYGCTSLTTLNLPALVSAGDSAFRGCSGLTELNLPALASVEDHTFSGCTGLTDLNLPALLTAGAYAFTSLAGLTELDLPALVSVGTDAFSDCTGLTGLALPALVSVGRRAFRGCTGLTALDLPALASVETNAFSGCTGLTDLNLPSLKTITETAFQGCTGLTAADLPELRTIDRAKAFLDCTSLTTIKLPKLASIGGYQGGSTFENCAALSELVLGSTPPTVSSASNIFVGIPPGTIITFKVPTASLTAYAAWEAANPFSLGGTAITRVFTAAD